jgi:TatD DNase family protein
MVKELGMLQKTKVELADAHSHLDLMDGMHLINEAIEYGVSTIITDGVDTKSNLKALEISDYERIFPALGVDPHNAISISEGELEFNFRLIKENAERIVAIGEIGLDYMIAEDARKRAKQKRVFNQFLDLAEQLDLPVSVHARKAIDDVLSVLDGRRGLKVQLHYFDGDVKEAKIATGRGYMISIPPVESGKRKRVIKETDIGMLLTEADSPVVGASPKDVERAVRMIGGIKGIDYERAAQVLTANAKKFFNINKEKGFMRY